MFRPAVEHSHGADQAEVYGPNKDQGSNAERKPIRSRAGTNAKQHSSCSRVGARVVSKANWTGAVVQIVDVPEMQLGYFFTNC